MIIEKSGVTNASAFQQLNEEVKRGLEGIEKAWCVSPTVREIDGNRTRVDTEVVR